MNALELPSHRPLPVPVEHCPGCRLVWFDALESVQLDGLGWTRLLRAMEHGRGRELAQPATGRPACLSCREPLRAVHNRTRFGRFSALECPGRHGHLQSHTSLLAERGLVRPLGAAERRALAAERHALHCFNCGGPARPTDDDCSWCGSPLVVVDLPRLAHSLRLRLNREFGASPAEQGMRVAWPCRGCGTALDASRQTECPSCGHLVVAHELPDLLPLIDAAEADLRDAARGRRAMPGSVTVEPRVEAEAVAPERPAGGERPAAPRAASVGNAPIHTRRQRRAGAGAGWLAGLPLLLLAGLVALGLVAILGAGPRSQQAGAGPYGLIGLGILALGAAAYGLTAGLFGLGAARVLWLVAALPLAWWGGRGHGVASVLLVGMLLAAAAIAGLVIDFVYRAWRAWWARRRDG